MFILFIVNRTMSTIEAQKSKNKTNTEKKYWKRS